MRSPLHFRYATYLPGMSAPAPRPANALHVRKKAGALYLLRRPSALLHLLFDAKAPRVAQLFAWAAIFYLVMPVDLIPDVIPIIGWLDDLGIVAATLAFVGRAAAKHEDERLGNAAEIVVEASPSGGERALVTHE